MTFFGSLARRMIGRKEHAPDLSEMRAHILGEYPPMPKPEPPGKFGRFESAGMGEVRAELPEIETPTFSVSQAPPELQQPLLSDRNKPELRSRIEERGIYELFDRLAVIESQLAALRAQVETVNERLKMIELSIKGARGYY